MTKTDIIENWLNAVSYSHSNSDNTRTQYTYHIQRFLKHIGKTADQILNDYEILNDKQFKRKYSPLIISLIGEMGKANYSPSTQQTVIATIKSFFKYNSLPLNYIPTRREYARFHNRPITKKEIIQIIKESQPREKAYYSLMVQSGLRPQTISNLKIGDFENLLEEKTPIPCLIIIRQEITKGKYSGYFTFTAKESVQYIKEYFKRQRKLPLSPEEFLFTMQDEKTPVKPDVINHTFARTVKKLRKQNIIDFKTDTVIVNNKKRTNNKIKLYNLRKYFRNNNNADWDYKNFWMGHISKLGVDKHYIDTSTTPENIEKHRQIYIKKAMLHLNIETITPDEIWETSRKIQADNIELKKRLTKIEKIITPKEPELPETSPERWKQLEKQYEKIIKWQKEHPEELKKQNARAEKLIKKYEDVHPEQDEEMYTGYLEAEVKELQNQMREIIDIIKQLKK